MSKVADSWANELAQLKKQEMIEQQELNKYRELSKECEIDSTIPLLGSDQFPESDTNQPAGYFVPPCSVDENGISINLHTVKPDLHRILSERSVEEINNDLIRDMKTYVEELPVRRCSNITNFNQ